MKENIHFNVGDRLVHRNDPEVIWELINKTTFKCISISDKYRHTVDTEINIDWFIESTHWNIVRNKSQGFKRLYEKLSG